MPWVDLSVPTTTDILFCERERVGTIDCDPYPEAAYAIPAAPGYREYRDALQGLLRANLGDEFDGWFLTSAEVLDLLRGVETKEYTDRLEWPLGVMLDIEKAKEILASLKESGMSVVLVKVRLKPENVVMRGDTELSEVVVHSRDIGKIEVIGEQG